MGTHNGWDDAWESPTYLDSPAFREYAAEIELIIHSADRPLCTREITDLLGEKVRGRWTADALEHIRSIEEVGILPTRYRRREGHAPKTRSRSREALALPFAK